VRHAPGVLIDKPDFGAGASTLASLMHVVLTGRLPAVIALERGNEEELRKHIDAAQLAGRSALFIDNVEKGGTLKSMALAQVLTEGERSIRILGVSQEPHVACTQLVVVTGVNVGVREDLVRRFVRCRLDPQVERAQERVFRRPDLLADAQRDRVALLTDLYTIAAAYVRSGARVTGTRLNGYEQWMRCCQEPLLWLGLDDPVLSGRSLEVDDDGLAAFGEIIELWWQAFGGAEKRVKDVMAFSNDSAETELRTALLAASGGSRDESKANALVGKYLKAYRAKIVDGSRLVISSTSMGTARWRLLPGPELAARGRAAGERGAPVAGMPDDDRFPPLPDEVDARF
jgi:hypothetical protein